MEYKIGDKLVGANGIINTVVSINDNIISLTSPDGQVIHIPKKQLNNYFMLQSNATAANTYYTTTTDNVNHPTHYNHGKYECIDVMIDTFGKQAVADFCKCNAFKYQWRAEQKNGIEDYKKADWYIKKYIELTKEI